MDRLRDAGRRGSASAPISSYLRRPRSCGVKDSPGEEEVKEDLNAARLRERPKKDSNSRHKRTRHSPREFVLASRCVEVGEDVVREVRAPDDDGDPIRLLRKPAKFRLHGKVERDESNAVELPAVPRKARTAMAKRPHESTRQDGSRQQYTASIPFDATHISPSGLSLNPVKQMKHNGLKVKKPPKIAMPVTISEQEVEVAEALFDLARMVCNMGSPLSDSRMESKIENGETRHVSSPESTPIKQSHIPTPSSSNSAVSSPTAPVFDKPAYLKTKSRDGTLITDQANILGSSAIEHNTLPSYSTEQPAEPKQGHADGVSTCQDSLHDAPVLVTPLSEFAHLTQNADVNVSLNWRGSPSIGVSDPTAESMRLAFHLKKQFDDGSKLDAGDALAEPLEKKVKIGEADKYEINLMEQPHGSCNSMDCVEIVKEEGNLLKSDTNLVSDNTEAGRGYSIIRSGRDMKVSRQEFTSTTENCKPEIVQQEESKGPGWAGGFSQAGYYPTKVGAAAAAVAVAAAWPSEGAAILMGEKSKMAVNKAPPFSFPRARSVSKRCATHIYIAHFIDTEQQVQRHPVWAAAYGNNTTGGIFCMKAPNATVSVPPFTPSITNSTVINPPIGHPKDKDSGGTQNHKGTVLGTDASAIVGASKLSETIHQEEEGSSMQAGLQNPFCQGGGPPAPSNHVWGAGGSSTSYVGANIAALVSSAGQSSKTQTASTAAAAAAQVQYIQAIIQQAGFPFSFPSGQLVSPNASHIPVQQPTQYFCNPFYSPHHVNPPPRLQQGPVTSRATSKASSLQNQRALMFQGGHGNLVQSLQQQQQEQQWLPLPSSSSSQSHQCTNSQQSYHVGEREGVETIPSALNKLHGYQKTALAQEIPTIGTMKLSQPSSQVQVHHESSMPTHALSHHSSKVDLPMGVNYWVTHAPSSLPMGAISKNMVHADPLGMASLGAVLAPQGHTVLETMAGTQLSDVQASKEQRQQLTHNRLMAPTQVNITKIDMKAGSGSRGNLGTKSGTQPVQGQHGFLGGSLKIMASPVGSMGAGQVGAASSSGPVTSAGPTPKQGAVLQGSTLSNTSSQYSSAVKPISRLQARTTSVSGAPSPLVLASYGGYPAATHQGQPSASLQGPIVSSQIMCPSTSSATFSFASKTDTSTAGKTTPPVEVGSNISQRHPPMVALPKKQEFNLTHSSAQGGGSTSMGQSPQQQWSPQHAMKQHQHRQQQQQQHPHKQQYLSFHQNQLPQLHQVLPQHFNGSSISSFVMQQYHQSLSAANQAGPAGLLKQSQQHGKRLYSEQHAVPSATQHRSAVNYNMHLLPDSMQQQQSSKRQAGASCQQPPPSHASFGISSSSGAIPTIPSSRGSLGSGAGGPPNRVTSPSSSVCMKPPAFTSVSCSMQQRPAIFHSGIPQSQSVGGPCAQPSNCVHYLSFSQPATLTSSAETTDKRLGAAYMHPQNGTSWTNATSLAVRRENGAVQHLNEVERPNTSTLTPAHGNSHSPVSGTSTKQSTVSHRSADANNATVVASSQVLLQASPQTIDSTATAKSSILIKNTTASA